MTDNKEQKNFFEMTSGERKKVVGYVADGSCRVCRHCEDFYCNQFKFSVEFRSVCAYFEDEYTKAQKNAGEFLGSLERVNL